MEELITMTTSQLDKLIKEKVREAIKEYSLLREYAYSRDEFKMRFSRPLYQSIVHLGAIYYTKSYALDNQKYTDCLNHWKGEVIALLTPIFKDSLKGGNNPKNRLKALNQEADGADLFDKHNSIKYDSARSQLFEKEGMDISDEQWSEIVNRIMEFLHEYIIFVANFQTSEFIKFVSNI